MTKTYLIITICTCEIIFLTLPSEFDIAKQQKHDVKPFCSHASFHTLLSQHYQQQQELHACQIVAGDLQASRSKCFEMNLFLVNQLNEQVLLNCKVLKFAASFAVKILSFISCS